MYIVYSPSVHSLYRSTVNVFLFSDVVVLGAVIAVVAVVVVVVVVVVVFAVVPVLQLS